MELTFKEACVIRDTLTNEMDASSKALDAFPKSGTMGLTPDEVKFSAEFQNAKARYNRAHASLRRFNSVFVKRFEKELQEERRARRFK